jgi:hypothetical protein
MREMVSENPAMIGSFTTDAMLADCRKYRGDAGR